MLIVREDDNVVCIDCYESGFDEMDIGTYCFGVVKEGVCGCCGEPA